MMRPIILIPLPFHFLIELPKRRSFLVFFWGGGLGLRNLCRKGGISNPYNDLATGGRNSRAYTKRRGGCLMRFSKFLGMSPIGYENEVLALMHKISGRRLDERGKEVQRMTKFDREMKKL